MKKFNQWANNINENVVISGSAGKMSSVNKDFKNQTKKFEDIVGKLSVEHEKEKPTNNVHKIDLDRRARLIRFIDLLNYEDLQQFLNDWNFIKTHAREETSSANDDGLNVIRNS